MIGKADAYLCEAGTTIIGRKGTINKPIFVNERFWNVDTAFGISPGDQLLPKFLYYFCMSFNFTLLDKSTTIPSLAKRDLLNIEMPVPTLKEQKRIVVRVEELFSKLDKGVDTLKTAKLQMEVYRQAVLKEAFEGKWPYSNRHMLNSNLKLNAVTVQESSKLETLPCEWTYVYLSELGELSRGKSKHSGLLAHFA